MRAIIKNKKGQVSNGLVGGLIFGIAGLIIGTIIALVIVSTLLSSGIITGTENTTATDMSRNFTAGIDNVSAKLPTVLLVAAIVLILGVLAFLVAIWQRMRLGGSI